jgi:hypothetical protein
LEEKLETGQRHQTLQSQLDLREHLGLASISPLSKLLQHCLVAQIQDTDIDMFRRYLTEVSSLCIRIHLLITLMHSIIISQIQEFLE